MAWETRPGCSGRFYTRTTKTNGTYTRTYVGTERSPAAQLAAAEDAMRKEARERARQDRRSEVEALEALDAPLLALNAAVATLFRATMLVSGYHQFDRGAWKRRRDRPLTGDRPVQPAPSAALETDDAP